jgi:outer membrane protein assembly factor BamB
MKASELVYIGIKGSVIALHRNSGKQAWATHLTGSNFVNVVLDGNDVIATCDGEVFCLDPLNGNPRWHNQLKGFGYGLATVATAANVAANAAQVIAEERRRTDDGGAAAICTTTAS